MSETEIDIPALIDARPVGAFQYVTIGLCALVMIIDGFDTQAISYAAPLIAREWGLPSGALGPIFSSSLIGLMLGYLALPPLSDRFGHRRVIILSTLFFALSTLATAFVHDLPFLIALRFLTGVGLGGVAPSAIALTGEYAPKQFRATFTLIIYCGFSLGFVIAGYVAAELLPRFGWPALFYVGGLFPLALTALLLPLLPDSLDYLVLRRGDTTKLRALLSRMYGDLALAPDAMFKMAARETGLPVRQLFRHGRTLATLLLWLVFFINLGAFYALQSWLPTIFHDMHYPLSTVALATSLTTVGGILIAFVTGPLMDRVGPYITLGTLYILGAVILVLTGAALALPLWTVMLATFLTGVCVSGGQKSVIALAAIYYPAPIRSTGVGWALGIGRIGGILGPLAVGFLFSAGWSPASVFYWAGLPFLVAGVAIFIIGRTQKDAKVRADEMSRICL